MVDASKYNDIPPLLLLNSNFTEQKEGGIIVLVSISQSLDYDRPCVLSYDCQSTHMTVSCGHPVCVPSFVRQKGMYCTSALHNRVSDKLWLDLLFVFISNMIMNLSRTYHWPW